MRGMIFYKFTTPDGKTSHGQVYSLPRQNSDGSWTPGEWVEPIDGALVEFDWLSCGAHRIHLVKHFDSTYAPRPWVCWKAEAKGWLGEDRRKIAFKRARLLYPIDIPALIREEGPLQGNLSRAYLRKADLRGTDLRRISFGGADLQEADLRRAKVYDLRGADLRGADLRETNLTQVLVSHTDLRGAKMSLLDRIFFIPAGARL